MGVGGWGMTAVGGRVFEASRATITAAADIGTAETAAATSASATARA